MQPSLCGDVGLPCLLKVRESTNVVNPAVGMNADNELLLLFTPANAKNSSLVVDLRAADVLHVSRMADVPQVRPSVVHSVAIDVVNDIGPFASNDEVDKPVFQNFLPIDLKTSIASGVAEPARPLSCRMFPPLGFPSKVAGLRVVIKNGADSFRAKIFSSHEALQKLIDQRPWSVGRATGALPF